MEQDKEATINALKRLNDNFNYPAFFYHEKPNGNISLLVMMPDADTVTQFDSSGQKSLNPNNFTRIRHVHNIGISIQSDARLFVVDGASQDDIDRVLDQQSKNKYITPR